VDTVRVTSRRWSLRLGLDADEVAGETLEHLAFVKIRPVDPVRYAISVTKQVAKDQHFRRKYGVELTAYETKAWHIYRSTCEKAQQELKRHLTRAEEDEIAERAKNIAERKNDKRGGSGVPSWFHRRRNPVEFTDRLPDLADSSDFTRPRTLPRGSLAARLDEEISASKGATLRCALKEAKKDGWDAFAQLYGAPRAVDGRITREQARICHEYVANRGGVDAIVVLLEQGGIDEEAQAVFFSPWGAPGSDEKRAILRVLRKHRAYSDDLWESALMKATVATRRVA